MRTRFPIRWQFLGLSAALAIGLPIALFADTSTLPAKTPQTSKPKTATGHKSGSQTHASKTHSATSKNQAKNQAGGQPASKTATVHKAGASKTGSSKSRSAHGKKGSKASRTTKKRGQQVIDTDRARAIQEALIRERYMQGEPSGSWDSATQAAMQKYQAAQGWQSKTTPDSRALIKLGLGPSHDHLLNPESAMTSAGPSASPSSNNPSATSKAGTQASPADESAPGPPPKDRPQH